MFITTKVANNFSTVLVNQLHWRSANAAHLSSATNGHLLDGTSWCTTLFSLTTSLGLVFAVFMLVLIIDTREVNFGLVPNADTNYLL